MLHLDDSINIFNILQVRNQIICVFPGCVRKSISVCKTPITKLEFVNPSICPQSNNRHQVYPTTTSCYVLVRGEDSSLHLLNCGQRNFSPPITIADKYVILIILESSTLDHVYTYSYILSYSSSEKSMCSLCSM